MTPAGKTLYLPGGTELRYTAGTASTSGTRYYSHGETIAVRASGSLTWLANDHHGTAQVAINSTTLVPTRRRSLPFGGPRGTQPAWPGDKGFVGGTTDPTGLTHLGAREYDPGIGRFVSVDPVLDNHNPQQMNGYAYANNNPTTGSDPTGLICLEECGSADDRVFQASLRADHKKQKEKAERDRGSKHRLVCASKNTGCVLSPEDQKAVEAMRAELLRLMDLLEPSGEGLLDPFCHLVKQCNGVGSATVTVQVWL